MGIMKMGGRLLRNLFNRPATIGYPAEPRKYPDASRGHLEFDDGDCILCNICGRSCPAGAIRADKTTRTVAIERMQCVQCGYCCDKCPKGCLSMRPGYTAPDASKAVDEYQVPERGKPAPEKRDQSEAGTRWRKPGASRGPMCRAP